MAVSTALKRALRLIAGALIDYAKDQGWSPEDYWIYYHINSRWDKIHITFVAKGLAGKGDFQNYASVRQYLESQLADEPELLNYMGLIVRSLKQVEEGGIYAIGPEYRDYWTLSRR